MDGYRFVDDTAIHRRRIGESTMSDMMHKMMIGIDSFIILIIMLDCECVCVMNNYRFLLSSQFDHQRHRNGKKWEFDRVIA